MSDATTCSYLNCSASVKNHRWGRTKADGWYFSRDNRTAYCPDHLPAWVPAWRRRKQAEAEKRASGVVDAGACVADPIERADEKAGLLILLTAKNQELRAVIAEAQSELEHLVTRAKAADATWTELAQALDGERDTVRRRFRHLFRKPEDS